MTMNLTTAPAAIPTRWSVPGLAPAVLMTAALGWLGGTYHWPDGGLTGAVLVTIAHLVPVVVAVLAIPMVVAGRRAGRIALTVLAATIKAVTVAAIIWIIVRPDGAGPHGFLDWVPIGLANAGGGLWIKSLIFGRRRLDRQVS